MSDYTLTFKEKDENGDPTGGVVVSMTIEASSQGYADRTATALAVMMSGIVNDGGYGIAGTATEV